MKLQTLLISTLAVSIATGQPAPVDPYRSPNAAAAPEPSREPVNISICYEAFSLPLAMAAKLQRQQLGDGELYKQLVAAVEKETARQETFIMLRSKSGQKATAESISEEIYPTEYQPPALPGTTGSPENTPPAKEQPKPIQFLATPTAFETRNVGTTLEIEPTCSDDYKELDVRLVPETVTQVARPSWGQGLSNTEMPTFETQRVNMAFSTRFNQPFLLGTISRPPASKVDPDSANRVWFAFVTPTLAKP